MDAAQPSRMQAAPRVAAIVLNYNYGRYLQQCLESLESQTYENLFVMVIDDNSSDGSQEIVRQWQSQTARPSHAILKDGNRGPAHSMNLAIANLPGDVAYVGFTDADDVWWSGKTSVQVSAFVGLAEDPVLVYSGVSSFEDGSQPRFDHASLQGAPRPPEAVVTSQTLLSGGSQFAFNSCLVRADALRAIEPLDESMRVTDYQLWLKLIRQGTFAYAPSDHAVAAVRRHPSSMSRTESVIAGDRLRLLGRTPANGFERRAARRRGRALQRAQLLRASKLPFSTYREYGIGARDPMAPLVWTATRVPQHDVLFATLLRLVGRKVLSRKGES